MNAFQPSKPPLQPQENRRATSQRRKRRNSYRVIALETMAKLTVNAALSVAAVVGLVRLLPDLISHQKNLQEIQTEVQRTELRVNNLRKDFNRNFDPQQAHIIMQQQSNRIAAGQRQVILLDKTATNVQKPTQSP